MPPRLSCVRSTGRSDLTPCPLSVAERGRSKADVPIPMKRKIVVGQQVNPAKIARSRELRQEMTHAEGLLWERLRSRRLQDLKFRRQQIIAGFIVDFYCDSAGLVIEVDGPIHATQEEQDARRDRVLYDHGLQVLRVTNDAVENNIEMVLYRIVECISSPPPLRCGEGAGG